MRHFGYFMTESTGHLSEYLPWFRKNQKALELYCDEPAFGGETRRLLQVLRDARREVRRRWTRCPSSPRSSGRAAPSTARTSSRPMETGNVFRLNGNVRNDGYITNLPDGCCVEVPDLRGPRRACTRRVVGDLPAQCAALNMTNVLVQGLAVEAALHGRPGAARAGRGARPADRRRADAEGDPGHDVARCWRRSARGCRSSREGSCGPCRPSASRRT